MDNRVVLAGRICSDPGTRHSPAGIPITRFTLDHVSRRREAGQEREVRCRIAVVAAGEGLQPRVQGLRRETQIRVRGFFASAGYRAGETRLVLHAEDIELLGDL